MPEGVVRTNRFTGRCDVSGDAARGLAGDERHAGVHAGTGSAAPSMTAESTWTEVKGFLTPAPMGSL